ncbi:hypothetical protein COU37_03900 [Candidatus Micrarchaeota archaeon CG10_big_fil_rev_8_21_14_0_10_45_29]|nr:MAG: hypothetical protein COU37_03900 [Candidatus Micrarchaeota archaeon CG10_big_fil_rev_8_21_14_0_10_45_29]
MQITLFNPFYCFNFPLSFPPAPSPEFRGTTGKLAPDAFIYLKMHLYLINDDLWILEPIKGYDEILSLIYNF